MQAINAFGVFRRVSTTAMLIGLLSSATVHPVIGQVLYGSFIGTVTDPSGSVVPNASVTVTAKDTGATKTPPRMAADATRS